MKKRNFLYLLLLLNQLAEGRQFQKAALVKKAIENANGSVDSIKRELASEPTFNFPVGCSIYNSYHQTTWLGAAENVEGDEAQYSLSCARHQTIEAGSGQFEATLIINSRATPKAHLFSNSSAGLFGHKLYTENPLYGKACKLMVEHNSNPLIVLKDSPSDLYYFSEILLDAQGNTGDLVSISRYSFRKGEVIHHVVSCQGNLYVFHSRNTFGQDETSQVTVLSIALKPVKIVDGKKEQVVDGAVVLDGDGKPVMVDAEKQFTCHKIKKIASKKINKSDDVFTKEGKETVARLGSEIKTVVHDNKLFVAFSIDSNRRCSACGLIKLGIEKKPEPVVEVADAQSGEETAKENLASAVVVSDDKVDNAQNNKKSDSSATKKEDSAAVEAKNTELEYDVIISSVAPKGAELTRLPFCTVNGASLLPKELAIMSTSTAANYLIYAAGNQVTPIPVDRDGVAVTKGVIDDFYSGGRFITRRHERGRGSSFLSSLDLPYEIETIQVVGDTIYVKDKVRQGAYSYRALFNEDGSIGGWCDAEYFATDENENIRLVSGQKAYSWYGVRGESSYSYNQTVWEETTKSMEEFVDAVNQSLPQNISGVQGLTSLSCNRLHEPRDLIVATGYNHAVYGYVSDSKVVDAQVVTLPDAGALVTAEVANSFDDQQEWLILGGVGGLYGLASSDGSGFGVVNGIDDLFVSDRSWKKIGNFSFVRKVIKDKRHGNILYVVTSQGVHRVLIDQTVFAAPQIEKVFDTAILGGRFDYVSDFIVDEEFAIVGTSRGIYVIEDMDDRTKTHKLVLDGFVGSVNQITALRGSKDFDNVYILSSNQQQQVSSVHRVVVRDKKCTLFADCTHQHGNDQLGTRGAFLRMESTCSSFFSNGSWNVKMNYPYKNEKKAIMFYTSSIRSGVDTIRTANRNNLSNMYLSCVQGSQNIAGMVHIPALSCWIIFGDFGLRILS